MISSKSHAVTFFSLISVSGLVLTYICRRRLSHFIWYIRYRKFTKNEKDIHIISEHCQWDNVSEKFCKKTSAIGALGFDCEWIQFEGRRRPVALMQLATYSGMCILFRLNHLQGNIPTQLKVILEDDQIVKVGVGTDIDVQYLSQDYGINVNGWVDLRHLAIQNIKRINNNNEVQEKLGLGALAAKYLDKRLNKDWRVRIGDWEAETLRRSQINYAAEDALVGIQVLLCLIKDLRRPGWWSLPPFRLKEWEGLTSKAINGTCRFLRNVKFNRKSSVESSSCKMRAGLAPSKPMKCLRSYAVRKSPLYYNSQLWAPDGEPLCTCDPRKAYWYVEKGLGDLVSESPLVVKLRFEPAGRPNREGIDGQFYLQERHNLCVVCGKEDSYIRKNIIPHEYRKHFPEVLKSHQSHDVVLLCTECHQTSNVRDNSLRYKLAEECNAPIGTEKDVKLTINGKLKCIRSAGGALMKSRKKLPAARVTYLENLLIDFFQVETLTEDHINQAAELDTQVLNEEYVPHGYKVFLNYRFVGLIHLEERWRQWFLESMEPKFLPENWSTTHNHQKLRIKMARHPLGDPIREEYKIAIVGTQGHIDIPYVPNKRDSSFYGLGTDSRDSSPEALYISSSS